VQQISILASVTPLPGSALATGGLASAAPPPTSQIWLRVLAPTPAFSVAMDPLWTAQPGERYAVRQIDSGWALVVWEQDPPEWQEWVQVDDRVDVSPGTR
jgi:hypothetical protein